MHISGILDDKLLLQNYIKNNKIFHILNFDY